MPVKRKPAPRLFCDICDIFDAHDTEDCPVQSSNASPMHAPAMTVDQTKNGNDQQEKKRVLPPPRKYCENCEGRVLKHFQRTIGKFSKFPFISENLSIFVLYLQFSAMK